MGWWVGALVVACLLLAEPGVAKRGKKAKKKKQAAQAIVPPMLSAAQKAAQEQRVSQGMQLAAAGRHADAEKAFSEVLSVDPTNYAALGNRALLLPQMQRVAEGVAALEHAARIYPADPNVPYNLGTLQASIGRDADAVENFVRTTEVAPAGSDVKMHATNSAGASLFKLDRPAEALHYFDAALRSQMKNPSAVDPKTRSQTVLNRGAALVKLGRSRESIEIFDQVLSVNPIDLATRLSRAQAWKEVGGVEAELQAAENYVSTLEIMAEKGIEEVQVEQGEGAGAKERVADIYDSAVYTLQAWERQSESAAAEGGEGEQASGAKLLEVSLPLWRRMAKCLDAVATKPKGGGLASMLGSMWGGGGDAAAAASKDGDGKGGAGAADGCVGMGLSEADCDAVEAVRTLYMICHATARLNPKYLANRLFKLPLDCAVCILRLFVRVWCGCRFSPRPGRGTPQPSRPFAGKITPFSRHSILNRAIYQARLGTNVGKALKQRGACSYTHSALARGRPVHIADGAFQGALAEELHSEMEKVRLRHRTMLYINR